MTKERIIMDVDPGIDDSLATIFALMHADIVIEGLTIVSGNVDATQGSKNLSFLLSYLNFPEKNIYMGAQKPLEIDFQDARDTHGEDGLGEVYYPSVANVQEQLASEYMLDILNRYPNEITIVAVGPLTNLAEVIKKDPMVLHKAKAIHIMGGADKVHGNCSPVAEYNFWVDPHAARTVFHNNLENIYLYPLDVTYKILFTPNMREMVNQFKNPISEFIYNITRFYVDFHWTEERTLGCVINDPLVVANLVKPLVRFEKADVDIVVDGLATAESICHYNEKGKVHVGTSVNTRAFFELFLHTMFPGHKEDILQQMNKEMF